jgi:hypothetical protein
MSYHELLLATNLERERQSERDREGCRERETEIGTKR